MSRAKRERGRASPEAVSKTTDLLLAPFAGELLETIETPVVLLDRTGAIMQFNAAACALTGYAAGEVIGRKVWDFLIPQEEIKAVKAVFAKTRRSEFPTHFVNDWLTRSQERRRLKWSNTVLHDTRGTMACILAAGIDITEDLRAAQELADRQAFLNSVINTAPAAVITIDEAGTILSFSPSAERLFGHRQADITGRKIDVLMPEPYRSEHTRNVRRYLETGEARIIGRKRPVTALRRDGSTFPMLLSIGEFSQSGARYFVGFIEDITAEEEARRKLEETRAQLQHVSRISMAGEMAAAIAHEVSQPLTAAVSFAEAADLLLEKYGRGPEEAARRNVRQCTTEMKRAGEILHRIRVFLERGLPDKRKQNLNEVVREATTHAFLREHRGMMSLRLQLAKDLPPVTLDRIEIQQVVVNLARNAFEAMENVPHKEITIETLAAGEFAEVRVADTGSGLDPSIAGQLFQPFVTSKANGMGIGLSICRSIVEAHGGSVHARPNEPQGAVFVIRLPLGD